MTAYSFQAQRLKEMCVFAGLITISQSFIVKF